MSDACCLNATDDRAHPFPPQHGRAFKNTAVEYNTTMQDLLTTFPKRSSFVRDPARPMVCRQCCLRFGMARWNFICILPNLSVDLLPRRRTTFNVGLANRYYMSFQGAIVLAKHKLKEACTFHSNNSCRPPRQLGKASNFPRRFQACGPPQRGCRHLGTNLDMPSAQCTGFSHGLMQTNASRLDGQGWDHDDVGSV